MEKKDIRLADRHCSSVVPGGSTLQPHEVEGYAKEIKGWEVEEKSIHKTFSFGSFLEMTAFLQAAAWISLRQDHHPDVTSGYDSCTIRYSTHSAGGLTENDFICAARIERLFQ